MIALRGKIATLSKQVERLSRDRSRNRFRRRYGKSSYRSKTPSRREDCHYNDDFCCYHNLFGSISKKCREPCILPRIRKTNHCYRRQYFGGGSFDSPTIWPSPNF
ncbi:hypothetical protein NPIL_154751 [Nephila pilipes]|uniref:Uncharacterized protein n=1 Tax=Nephila pilipes TaxID=299642 RepID=A0A8X6Q3M0_NEPPI|nr:hypothetical protein NPIL_154751 [Nephila pilipes]